MYNSIFLSLKNALFDGTFPNIYTEELTSHIATFITFISAFMPLFALFALVWLLFYTFR